MAEGTHDVILFTLVQETLSFSQVSFEAFIFLPSHPISLYSGAVSPSPLLPLILPSFFPSSSVSRGLPFKQRPPLPPPLSTLFCPFFPRHFLDGRSGTVVAAVGTTTTTPHPPSLFSSFRPRGNLSGGKGGGEMARKSPNTEHESLILPPFNLKPMALNSPWITNIVLAASYPVLGPLSQD